MLIFKKLQYDKNWHNYLESMNRFNKLVESHEVCKCEDGCRRYIMVTTKLYKESMELLKIYKQNIKED